MRKLCWRAICGDGDAMHVAYVERSTAGAWEVHRHDFYEVFWVESGRGRHLLGARSGKERDLVGGSLVFVRPDDAHGFVAQASTEPFALINVAFSSKAWARLREYYGLSGHGFFHERAGDPPTLELVGTERMEVSRRFRALLHAPRSELVRDAFLLGLACRAGEASEAPGLERAPVWLRRTLLGAAQDLETLRGGPAALAKRAGCSGAHLSRTMRAVLGMAPSEWVAAQRRRRAEQLLEATGLSVAEVAAEAGFENLSHFHRCFRVAKGETPLRYRKARARAIL